MSSSPNDIRTVDIEKDLNPDRLRQIANSLEAIADRRYSWMTPGADTTYRENAAHLRRVADALITDVPALLDEVERLRKENARLQEEKAGADIVRDYAI